MDKLQLTGCNLGRVFNFRYGCVPAIHLRCYEVELPNLKLKTRPKQLLGSLRFVIVLLDMVNGMAHSLDSPLLQMVLLKRHLNI
jgi:hypothetical protein